VFLYIYVIDCEKMSNEFEFMANTEDPAADFLARESEELGDLGNELGLSQASEPQEDLAVAQNGFDYSSHSRNE